MKNKENMFKKKSVTTANSPVNPDPPPACAAGQSELLFPSRRGRANFGAFETPRRCSCGSSDSKVNNVYRYKGEDPSLVNHIVRKRQCLDCGLQWTTYEKI